MKSLTHSWWILGLRGLFAMLFAVVAFLSPEHTLRMLVLLFGCYALANGVFALGAGIRASDRKEFMRASLLEGLLGIGIGVITLALPQITEIMVVYMVAVWAILTGLFGIFAVDREDHVTFHGWPLSLFGAASMLVGTLLLFYPRQGASILVLLLASYSLVFGAIVLHLAWRLWAHQHHAPHNTDLNHASKSG
jgi:uncharacterized membrane protein HdeD (DUF308 family)